MWQKQILILDDGSRSNGREQLLWAAVNGRGRTLGVHSQLLTHSLPQQRGFDSLGSDGARCSKANLGSRFLTKAGFVGQPQFAGCVISNTLAVPRLGQLQPGLGQLLQLLPFPAALVNIPAGLWSCSYLKTSSFRGSERAGNGQAKEKGEGNFVMAKP